MKQATLKKRQRCRRVIPWLSVACLLLADPAAHGQEATQPPPPERESAEDSEEKTETEPSIEFEDGEVVIDRDGAETVIDEDAVTPTELQRDADPTIEEVVVIGIQRALDGALQEKRQTANLTDVINAENIGKLPDENVAEVLENIPGVQITRSAGIGEGVSIRGSDENRVEINGRGTVSDGDDRGGMRFSDLPAILVRSLTVTKVPTADMVEGSVGGTINVKTFRGLKLEEPLLVGNYRAEYADNANTWNNNYAGTLGNKFETPLGDLGGILTISHIEKTIRQDVLQVRPAFGNQYFQPGFTDTYYGTEDRTNTTVSGSLEWQPDPTLRVFAEGTYTKVDADILAQTAFGGYAANSPIVPRDALFDSVSIAGTEVPSLEYGLIGEEPDSGLQLRPRNVTQKRDTESFLAAVGGEWLYEDWAVEVEANASVSDSTRDSFITSWQYNDPGAANFHSADARVRVPFLFDATGDTIAYGPIPNTPSAANLMDPSYYSLYVGKDTTTQYDNRLLAQRVDVDRFLDTPILTTVGFGVRFSQRSSERQRASMVTENFPCNPSRGNPCASNYGALTNSLVPTPGNFFDFNSGGDYMRNFLTADPADAKSLRQQLIATAGLGANETSAPQQNFTVDENTSAAYLRFDFETDLLPWPIRGNFGARFVHTDQTAKGDQFDEQSQDFSPYTKNQKYYNFLPSASLVAMPLEDVQLRFGFAEILRRPNFAQLAPTIEYPLNPSQTLIVGNPNLRPTTAWQVDAGIEWYFLRGSVISAGYFYKNLDNVIGTEIRYNAICNPFAVADFPPGSGNPSCPNNSFNNPIRKQDAIYWKNLAGGRIQGVELALQHKFNWLPHPFNGFGVVANYAWQDGERDEEFPINQGLVNAGVPPGTYPLNFRRLSEHSYNVTLYYEKPRWGFSGRIRYTWRSGFLLSENSDTANNLPLYRNARGQLNASLSLQLPRPFDFATLILWGVNLTKEQTTETAQFLDGPTVQVRDADRRIAIGIRARY